MGTYGSPITPPLATQIVITHFYIIINIEMIRSIIYYVNFYFPKFKTELYPYNFIKACLVYQFLYIKYFSYELDLNQIIYRLSDYKHICSSNSSILTNHLIFSLAFREFWKHYKLGRGCVYVANTPFKESEVLGYLTGIVFWFFYNSPSRPPRPMLQ